MEDKEECLEELELGVEDKEEGMEVLGKGWMVRRRVWRC